MHRAFHVAYRVLLTGLVVASRSVAQTPLPAVWVDSAAGQQALSVALAPGALRASVCAAQPCAFTSGATITLAAPAPFDAALSTARVERVAIGRERSGVLVVATDTASGQHWVSLVVAPLTGAAPTPLVVFQGLADVEGNANALETSAVRIATEGAPQVLIGSRQPGFTLCGRPAMLAPQVLDATDLTLKPVKLQRLDRAERDSAPTVVATRISASHAPAVGRLLSAEGASSALGSPAALVDGDAETTWSEARSGDGRGELVVLRAPREVPITSLSIVVRPPTREIAHGVAPRHLWIAADDGVLVHVSLPEDAWKHPGAAYDARFAAPIATSCLAVVLDDAYGSKTPANDAVTIAEIEAQNELDGQGGLPALVTLLNGDDARGRQAAAVLLRGGAAARAAVATSYDTLGERGRIRALDVADQGACEESAPLYARALAGSFEGERIHARTRLERCRRKAAPALEAAVLDPAHPARVQSALVLATAAPERALDVLVRRPDETDLAIRAGFRHAIARAAASAQAPEALARLLDDTSLAPTRALELARYAGPALASPLVASHAADALGRAAPDGAAFALRYLSLAPLGVIAGVDAGAAARLERVLGASDSRLRAEAARSSAHSHVAHAHLVALTADSEPRVREAAAEALAADDETQSRTAIARLLRDEWTFVRSAAASALSHAAPDRNVDAALREALTRERVPDAQVVTIDALSARHALGAETMLREISADETKSPDVRVHATEALGGVCAYDALSYLDTVLRRGLSPGADASDFAIADAALRALGHIHPGDLSTRLAPYLRKGSPPALLAAIRAALDQTSTCAPRR